MKRALITVATLSILASTGWVVEAKAQANIDPNVYPRHMGERYGARGPAYGPSRRYARRAYRRSARQTYRAQTSGAGRSTAVTRRTRRGTHALPGPARPTVYPEDSYAPCVLGDRS